jgi:hypothetical protein
LLFVAKSCALSVTTEAVLVWLVISVSVDWEVEFGWQALRAARKSIPERGVVFIHSIFYKINQFALDSL